MNMYRSATAGRGLLTITLLATTMTGYAFHFPLPRVEPEELYHARPMTLLEETVDLAGLTGQLSNG